MMGRQAGLYNESKYFGQTLSLKSQPISIFAVVETNESPDATQRTDTCAHQQAR
jgi:hypothetical protein